MLEHILSLTFLHIIDIAQTFKTIIIEGVYGILNIENLTKTVRKWESSPLAKIIATS